MIKVKDQYGKEIPGLYRGKNGSLVVNDNDSFTRYKRQKQQTDFTKSKIEMLENEIHNLKFMLNKLMNAYENNK